MVELEVHRAPATRSSATAWFVAFIVVEAAVLLAIVTGLLPHLLPAGLATQVGHNSESFALAILLSCTVLWQRRRPDDGGRWWTAGMAATAVALGVLGLLLLGLDGAPRLKTLNEPVFAAALLVPYCAVRPRSRWLATTSLVVLVLTVALFGTDLVRLQAECVVALILAPVGLDLVARWMLARQVSDSVAAAWVWTAFLFLTPFALMALKPLDLGSFLDATVLYAARGNEAFWGLALVHALGLLAWAPRATGLRRGAHPTEQVMPG
ncbi:hypothetical protein [Nocardioides sp. URHA0020]|uniref:hypothetical protein n=1 Tax=Nocardioides sp. URHA0020 TaxID=1380392 RepID=UPI000490447F|nr:hypothetical protein [Nocardioides sp. URHA0020]